MVLLKGFPNRCDPEESFCASRESFLGTEVSTRLLWGLSYPGYFTVQWNSEHRLIHQLHLEAQMKTPTVLECNLIPSNGKSGCRSAGAVHHLSLAWSSPGKQGWLAVTVRPPSQLWVSQLACVGPGDCLGFLYWPDQLLLQSPPLLLNCIECHYASQAGLEYLCSQADLDQQWSSCISFQVLRLQVHTPPTHLEFTAFRRSFWHCVLSENEFWGS